MSETATPVTDAIREEIRKDVIAELEGRAAKELADLKKQLEEQNQLAIDQAIAEFRAEQKPPSQEEISTLLSQDYLEFKVTIPWEKETRIFTITELPQRMEKKFYAKFKEELIPRAGDVAALTYDLLSGDTGNKITALLNAFEPSFDLMAEACVMILNPRNKEEAITKEWVQDNLSSYRQWNIIYAQIQVNRLRDFFSQLSRGSKGMGMTLPAPTRN